MNNINERTIRCLSKIIDELKELESFIGLGDIKKSILEHVLYMAQKLNSDTDMNHIQIVGEPGVGKTTLAVIIGKMYAGLGFLAQGDVVCVTRADLIGEHLGSTSIKTEAMLTSCLGNVIFIDEVYSFGCADRKDSFSKECLDCINHFLSTYREDILCIIAGYEEDIQECVFSVNKGLERRFPFKYTLPKYNITELRQIFLNQVSTNKWTVERAVPVLDSIFNENNTHLFQSSGGDTEILFVRCKMAHSSRLFLDTKKTCKKKQLNDSDLRKGFDMFLALKTGKRKNNLSMMYI